MNTLVHKLREFFFNKKILVTGGTGSIGEKIVSSLLTYHPKEVVVFSRDDSRQYLMERKYSQFHNLHFHLGDIRDFSGLEHATRGMDIVFHAAALKQVPVCEQNPYEAVKTNVMGSENVIQASILNKVKKVINISTDKAVNPTNMMGITKLMSEKLFHHANELKNNSATVFSSVRFGNVIGSRGSVIPLFLDQVKSGQPITITDPKMTRFFMTIPEAITLTLKAAYYSKGGETFIFKMNAIELSELGHAIKEYSKQKGNQEPEVKVIGIRSGEKIYEELVYSYEMEYLMEDDELYVIVPPSYSNSYWHFRPATITSYRSDQVKRINQEKMILLLQNLDSE